MHTWHPLGLVGVVAIAACGCGGSKDEGAGEPSEAPAEVRIAFGDCASKVSRFESGPRPWPAADVIGDEEALDRITRLDSPPEKKDPGGTGTKMALDEGKMGTRDSSRQSGQYGTKAGVLGALRANPGGAFASLTGTADFSSGIDDVDVYGGLLGSDVGTIQGGFGFGTTGGGTGWGTIGTGRSGLRGRRPRPGSGARVRIGRATTVGDLDKSIIRRYIRRQIPRIRGCYEKQLLVDPSLAGTIIAQFQISPNGAALAVTAKGMGKPAVESCVAAVIKQIRFPKPKGGGLVNARYPFTFRSSGRKSSRPGAIPPAVKIESDEATPTPVPVAKAKPEAPAEPYVPGASNPLGEVKAALQVCLRKAGTEHGVAVVELTAGPDGALTATSATGVADKLSGCLASAAKTATLPASKRPERTVRCPMAFGEMPITKAPGIDITDKVIRLDGKEVARIKQDILDTSSMEWKVRPLYDKLLARREPLDESEASEEVVAITGPDVVRPVATTTAKVLFRVLKTAYTSSSDALLATDRGGEWKLLRDDIALPVAPVRLNSGKSWRPQGGIGSGSPRIAVLIAGDKIWAGTTTGKRESGDLASLASRLEGFKKLDGFDRIVAIEVSAEDQITYDAIVAVIDAAKGAGFTSWSLLDPQSLSVRFQE